MAAYARSHPDPQVQLVAVASAAAVLVASVAAVWADRWIRWLPASWHDVDRRCGCRCASPMRWPRTAAAAARCCTVLAWSVARPGAADPAGVPLGLGLGLTVPSRYYLLFMPLGLLMLLLPISVSGFGLPQGVIVWLLRPLGVPDDCRSPCRR